MKKLLNDRSPIMFTLDAHNCIYQFIIQNSLMKCF